MGEFPEQTPYLEWLNSVYPSEGTTCQNCHMPESVNPQDIATTPPWHDELRSPFVQHEFVGANLHLLELIRENAGDLGITASDEQISASETRTQTMLNSAASLQTTSEWVGDTLRLDVTVLNHTGHKLPTGIPLRRMWLHVTAYNSENAVLWESGSWDAEGRITGIDAGYEPHHNTISDPDQVQIYEGVMQDVDEEVTWTLLRAGSFAKDNRLPPEGFTSDHSEIAHIAVTGTAADDADFNRENSIEGTGQDIVHYLLPDGTEQVTIELVMQTVTPNMLTDLAIHDTPEVNAFTTMQTQAGNEPVQLVNTVLAVTPNSVDPGDAAALPSSVRLESWPNPVNGVATIAVTLEHAQKSRVEIVGVDGRHLATLQTGTLPAGQTLLSWPVEHVASGLYLVRLLSEEHNVTRKVIVMK